MSGVTQGIMPISVGETKQGVSRGLSLPRGSESFMVRAIEHIKNLPVVENYQKADVVDIKIFNVFSYHLVFVFEPFFFSFQYHRRFTDMPYEIVNKSKTTRKFWFSDFLIGMVKVLINYNE